MKSVLTLLTLLALALSGCGAVGAILGSYAGKYLREKYDSRAAAQPSAEQPTKQQ